MSRRTMAEGKTVHYRAHNPSYSKDLEDLRFLNARSVSKSLLERWSMKVNFLDKCMEMRYTKLLYWRFRIFMSKVNDLRRVCIKYFLFIFQPNLKIFIYLFFACIISVNILRNQCSVGYTLGNVIAHFYLYSQVSNYGYTVP